MKCHKCGRTLIKSCYRIFRNGDRHLAGLCEYHGWLHLPFKDGLDLPEITKTLKSNFKDGKRIDATFKDRPIKGQMSLLND